MAREAYLESLQIQIYMVEPFCKRADDFKP